jgi:hypothetical protein
MTEQLFNLSARRGNGPPIACDYVVRNIKYALLLPLMVSWTIVSVASAQELVSTIQTPGIVSEPQPPPTPITPYERLEWFTKESIAPTNLLGSAVLAGWGTLFNNPREYGTHWDGFGDRYGMVMSSVVTGNAMEAGLGAIWGEDPRYRRASVGSSMGGRLGHIIKWTFAAPGGDGTLRPAYARYLAITGTSFLSNTWREPSEADSSHALERTGLGLLGRMASNAWSEFWPDAKRKFFHHATRD